jgi:tetratricopeptide (TPR) repeat protein
LGIFDDHAGVSRRCDSYRRRNRALDIRKRVHKGIPTSELIQTGNIRLYNAEVNLGCTYLQDEGFGDAEEIFERCLTRYKSWAPEAAIPFEYAKYYNHMSLVRTSQGKNEDAVHFSRHACDLQLRASGPDSPLFQLYRFTLGNILYHANHVDESLSVNEQVLLERQRICGDSNAWTLESYSMATALLHARGENDKAR